MNEKRLPPRLMVLLVVLKGEKVYKVPINSFIFESIITADTNPYKGQLASAAVQFRNEFTDNDGMFISFNQLDRNNWIFQLNFSIA